VGVITIQERGVVAVQSGSFIAVWGEGVITIQERSVVAVQSRSVIAVRG
jgi:hypothetical protein